RSSRSGKGHTAHRAMNATFSRRAVRTTHASVMTAAVVAACGDRDHHRAPPRPPADSRAARDGVRRPLLTAPDGAAIDLDAPPPEVPRVLAGPLAACVRHVREATPSELAGALDAIEYVGAAEDACRLDLAVLGRDLTLCDDVQLSTLRERCR